MEGMRWDFLLTALTAPELSNEQNLEQRTRLGELIYQFLYSTEEEKPREQTPEEAEKEAATLELLERAGRKPVRRTSSGES